MDKDYYKLILAFTVMLCAVSLFILLLIIEIPQGIKEPLLISFGVFVAKFQTVVDYFFGSSEGSNEKTKLLKGK